MAAALHDPATPSAAAPGPLGRLWRLASWFSGGPSSSYQSMAASDATPVRQPPQLVSSHELFARLGEELLLLLLQQQQQQQQQADYALLLPVLRALAAKPSSALRRWRIHDEVPLLVGVLRVLSTSTAAAAAALDNRQEDEREEVALLALETLRRWASLLDAASSPLALDIAWAGARAGSESSAADLATGGTDRQTAALIMATMGLWLLLAARAPTATEAAAAVQETGRLLLAPRAVEVLLAAGEEAWRSMLSALLFLDADADAMADPVRYRGARLALEAVARAPALWAWDALAGVLGEALARGASGSATPVAGWRRAVVRASCDAMEGDAVCPWVGHAAGAVAAAALLAQSGSATTAGASAAAVEEAEENTRLWRAFPRLTQAMAPVVVERRWTATPAEEVDWKTARVALTRALMLLGLSPFCTRAFAGERRKASPHSSSSSSAAAPAPPGGSSSWVPPQEWGACLTALLRLSFEEVVSAAAAHAEEGGQQQRRRNHQPLAHALCEQGLAPSASQEWARALTNMFNAADGENQRKALLALRTYSRAIAAAATASASRDEVQRRTRRQEGAYGAALVLQTCMVLADPSSSAAVGLHTTEQATRVFEILQAVSGLVSLGGGGGGGAGAALEWALLRAVGNLQSVLEEDGEEGGLRNARDWAMRELRRAAAGGEGSNGSADAAQAGNRRAFLVHLAFALCVETRRPAPHSYVAELTKALLDHVARGKASSNDAATAVVVHKCLRRMMANPHLLAYRAGRKEHWDEARRRVTAAYIAAALASYPATTRFSDLAYAVGAALGAIPTAGDPGGQAVLLHCIGLLQDRVLALIRGGDGDERGGAGDAQLRAPATVELVRLLFQTLIVCPPALLGPVLDGLERDFFLQGLRDRPEARLRALRLLKEVVFGEVEAMRQARLAKWYLRLLDDEAAMAKDGGANGVMAPRSRL